MSEGNLVRDGSKNKEKNNPADHHCNSPKSGPSMGKVSPEVESLILMSPIRITRHDANHFALHGKKVRRTSLSMRNFLKKVATFFGVGLSPKAPGTVATVATIPLVVLLSWAGPLVYMAAIVVLLPVGILAAEIYEQDKGGHDHSEIVIDEVVGFLITMVWLPMTWQAILIGFVLFRLLDITKPLFIGYLDKKIQGGLGVMIDDIAAGIVASLIMQVLYTRTNWLGSQILVP